MSGKEVDTTALTTKRVVFVGGLAEGATVALVRAAMIPFGPIHTVDLPMDYATGKHKGFVFVEYTDPDDAEEAVYNMDGAEILGRSVKANLAQANQVHKLSLGGGKSEAVWNSDEWFQNQTGNNEEERRKFAADKQALTE